MECGAEGVVDRSAVEVGAVFVEIEGVLGRGEDGEELIPEVGPEEEAVDVGAVGCVGAGEFPTACAGDDGEADGARGVEGARGIRFRQGGEDGSKVFEVGLEGLPAKAGGSADEGAAFEEIADAFGVGGDGGGEVFEQFAHGQIADDDGRERNRFSGFARDADLDGRREGHDLNLQWGSV